MIEVMKKSGMKWSGDEKRKDEETRKEERRGVRGCDVIVSYCVMW